MATKQAHKAEEQKDQRYVYAVGRRKTSVVQARLYPVATPEKTPSVSVNTRDFKEYFGTERWSERALAPLRVTGLLEQFRVTLVAKGGGIAGQSDAARLAIARALVKHDIALRPTLKAEGFLVRDAREVERKKPGLKKARKSPQWAKR
jgi:small subunit ribosomal protein S9